MILHVDMDAFYASIEIRDNPHLAGLPVVVGGAPTGRGVIAAASYESRRYGIHSAMSSAQALRLCPQIVFVKPRIEHYAKISKQIREIFFGFTSVVEPLSLDEAFLDVSGSEALFGDGPSIARMIKDRIRNEIGLTASAGVAPNKFLAKLASDLQKPDGLTIVPPDQIEGFLNPLAISRVWGVGKQTLKKFDSIGVHTIKQLRDLSVETLSAMFGVNGEHFWRLARGLDTRAVVPDRDAKSVSHESTFHTDIFDEEVLRAWILELSDQVARRLRRYGILGRTVQLKLRYSNFETITRSRTLSAPTNSTRVLSELAVVLFNDNKQHISRGVRLLGMGVSHLGTGESQQMLLFDREEKEKDSRVDSAADKIRDRFGKEALTRAANLQYKINHRAEPRTED